VARSLGDQFAQANAAIYTPQLDAASSSAISAAQPRVSLSVSAARPSGIAGGSSYQRGNRLQAAGYRLRLGGAMIRATSYGLWPAPAACSP